MLSLLLFLASASSVPLSQVGIKWSVVDKPDMTQCQDEFRILSGRTQKLKVVKQQT